MLKICSFILKDLIKNWAVIGYLILLSVGGWGVFILVGEPEKSLLILLQIVLLALPLITMVFATIYYYNSLEFITLLLAQPINRKSIIYSFLIGLGITFVGCFILGIGIPLWFFYPSETSLFLLASGSLLTLACISIAIYICAIAKEKTKGMGFILLLWAFFAFLFDGLLLYFMYQFGEYPIEKVVLGISFLNPIVITRITVIMGTEASALLGLSGAVFKEFFGSSTGIMISISSLLLWVLIPFQLTKRKFLRKDF